MTSGLLVVDKPPGVTSFGVVAAVRRATGLKKVGHAGTLDPLATGVLVVALGSATRLIRYVQDGEKEYVASIQFGIATDSLDADGEVTERIPMDFDEGDLQAALSSFRGEIEQVPPMVSALKFEGRRLYDLARSGEEVHREPRPVTITALELLDFDAQLEFPRASVRVVASKGTYIRSLADDLARALGGRGHVRELRRTRVGTFDLARAISVDDLEEWESRLLPATEAVAGFSLWLVAAEYESVRNGRPLDARPDPGPWAMLAEDGSLLAVYRRVGRKAVAEVVLA